VESEELLEKGNGDIEKGDKKLLSLFSIGLRERYNCKRKHFIENDLKSLSIELSREQSL